MFPQRCSKSSLKLNVLKESRTIVMNVTVSITALVLWCGELLELVVWYGEPLELVVWCGKPLYMVFWCGESLELVVWCGEQQTGFLV